MIKQYTERLINVLEQLNFAEIETAANAIKETWLSGKQIIVFGNGGSALTAQHYVTDWNKSVYLQTKRPFYGRTLVDNLGLVTAYANDISYNDIFLSQLKTILKDGDLVLAISGSGNSENVLRAVKYAKEQGNPVLGVCGFAGGKLKELSDYLVWTEIDDMQLSEDVHSVFGHMVTQFLVS